VDKVMRSLAMFSRESAPESTNRPKMSVNGANPELQALCLTGRRL